MQDQPERLDRFMARAVAAYYSGRDPFGAAGDFTTAPEISQAFGECLGLWAAVTWQLMGCPTPVLLIELGPGRGTLMADALRAAAMVPAFRAALRVHLVETSPTLRAAQRQRLGAAVAAWHDDIAGLPAGPAIILANEFFDALPIRQFIRRGGAWLERHVAAGRFVDLPVEGQLPPPSWPGQTRPSSSNMRGAADGRVEPGHDGGRAQPSLPPDAPDGAVAELAEAGMAVAAGLAARLRDQGGALLALDYGYAEPALGDSLQAMTKHGRADPLAEPGTVDVTAHVPFGALAAAGTAAGAAAHGPLPMGLFLQRLGLMQRAAILARSAATAGRRDQAGLILSGAERLTAPEGMGRLFKALCLCHPALPIPPGFEAA